MLKASYFEHLTLNEYLSFSTCPFETLSEKLLLRLDIPSSVLRVSTLCSTYDIEISFCRPNHSGDCLSDVHSGLQEHSYFSHIIHQLNHKLATSAYHTAEAGRIVSTLFFGLTKLSKHPGAIIEDK